MTYLAPFFAGAFLCNAIPHLANGLSGSPFPTPFARPRGKGDSSPLVNFLWGFFNLAAGLALLETHPVALELITDCLIMAAGALVLGLYLSVHFGKVKQSKSIH
jgi:hypothetical protein